MVSQYFTIIFTICSQSACLQQLYKRFARRVFTIHSQSECFTIIFTMFIQILCFPVLILLFIIYIHRGNWGSWLTFISSLQFFCYVLSLSASNGSYLYFLLLWQGNYFYSLLGREGWLGLPLFLVTEERFLRVYWVAGFTFIIGYQSRRF